MSLFHRFLPVTNLVALKSTNKHPKRSKSWSRPKPADRKLRDPVFLEHRETVSDTFFVALQAAGASLLGGIAAEKARDPFGRADLVDISVAGVPNVIHAEMSGPHDSSSTAF